MKKKLRRNEVAKNVLRKRYFDELNRYDVAKWRRNMCQLK